MQREPLTVLAEITDAVPYFFGDDVEYEEGVYESNVKSELGQKVLAKALEDVETWAFDDEEKLHEQLADFRAYFKEQGIKPKETMWAIRAAVTGRTRGADMVSTLLILGKDKVKARIQKTL